MGASNNLLRELREEDAQFYQNITHLDPYTFEEIFSAIEDEIQKQNTTMRMAIPARVKLEITLRFWESGDSFRSLSHLFRVPVSSISEFLPEVLNAITTALSIYSELSKNNAVIL